MISTFSPFLVLCISLLSVILILTNPFFVALSFGPALEGLRNFFSVVLRSYCVGLEEGCSFLVLYPSSWFQFRFIIIIIIIIIVSTSKECLYFVLRSRECSESSI